MPSAARKKKFGGAAPRALERCGRLADGWVSVCCFILRRLEKSILFPYTTLFRSSMQISISSLQTHNVNRCGRSRHLARKLSLRRKRSSPNVFEMAATETITSIILIKLIRVSLGTVRHPRRFKIVVRSEERFSRNAETDLVCRLLLEKKKNMNNIH